MSRAGGRGHHLTDGGGCRLTPAVDFLAAFRPRPTGLTTTLHFLHLQASTSLMTVGPQSGQERGVLMVVNLSRVREDSRRVARSSRSVAS